MNMLKKILIFGGGTGLSQLLKGLKLFPVEITAVVTVADNGKSTGMLRKDMNTPAVGDISKVMLSMANIDNDVENLMNYRFKKTRSLNEHSIKNLLLTALLDMKGNFDQAIPVLCKLLDIEGTILPLTEDSIELVGITSKGKEVIGEHQITSAKDKIIEIKYDKEFKVNPKIYTAINESDLIIFSSGSLFTSIIPHLIDHTLCEKIKNAQAKKLYVCNLFTQPGETDGFKVSDHIKLLNRYFDDSVINAVVANNNYINDSLAKKYLQKEQKDFVLLDSEELKKMDISVIESDLVVVPEKYFRHDALKTAYLIFSYIMDGDKK